MKPKIKVKTKDQFKDKLNIDLKVNTFFLQLNVLGNG
jgi:hypothetical protein